jgi:hypothetical protein
MNAAATPEVIATFFKNIFMSPVAVKRTAGAMRLMARRLVGDAVR